MSAIVDDYCCVTLALLQPASTTKTDFRSEVRASLWGKKDGGPSTLHRVAVTMLLCYAIRRTVCIIAPGGCHRDSRLALVVMTCCHVAGVLLGHVLLCATTFTLTVCCCHNAAMLLCCWHRVDMLPA